MQVFTYHCVQVSGPTPSFDERPDSVDADTQRISAQLIADMRVRLCACHRLHIANSGHQPGPGLGSMLVS